LTCLRLSFAKSWRIFHRRKAFANFKVETFLCGGLGFLKVVLVNLLFGIRSLDTFTLL